MVTCNKMGKAAILMLRPHTIQSRYIWYMVSPKHQKIVTKISYHEPVPDTGGYNVKRADHHILHRREVLEVVCSGCLRRIVHRTSL